MPTNGHRSSVAGPWSSALILGVFAAAWAALHSLLAGRAAKRLARERFGPGVDRWYRVFFVGVASITLAPLLKLLISLPDRTLYVVRSPWRWLMRVGQILSAAGVVATVAQVGLLRFVGLPQMLGRDQHETLATDRFYGCVRHPMTLFSLFLIWLWPTMTLNRLVSIVATTLYFLVGIRLEERKLIARFGDTYRAYRERVPALIPRPDRCLQAWRAARGGDA